MITDCPDVDSGFKAGHCYKNNQRLKAINVDLNLTKEQFAEYLKCSNDPIYFAKTYVKIVNIDLGLIDFNMRDYQEDMVNTIHDNRFTICKMARQTGKSTTVVSYFLWYILFQPDQSVGILANKQSLAIDIMDRLKLAYEHLPWFLQQGIITWNKKQIELENGSKCLAGSTSSSSVRGMTFNCVVGSSVITVRNKKTGEIEKLTIDELKNRVG